MQWINKFVEELKNDKWVLPALKQIREICQLFTEVSRFYKMWHYCTLNIRNVGKLSWTNYLYNTLKVKRKGNYFPETLQAPQNFTHAQRTPHVFYRNQVINQLQSQHSIVMVVAQNLSAYMQKARIYAKGILSTLMLCQFCQALYTLCSTTKQKIYTFRASGCRSSQYFTRWQI